MQVTVHNVLILKDKMTTIPQQPWDWELPVLLSKFPDGLAKVNGSTFVERDKLPEANEEFGRLMSQYGVEEDTKQAHVDLVYGRSEAGIKALEKAISDSVLNGKTKPEPKVEASEEPKAKGRRKSKAKGKPGPKAKISEEPIDPLS